MADEAPREWWDNVCAITRDLIETGGADSADLTGIGVTGMLPAVVLPDARWRHPAGQHPTERCALRRGGRRHGGGMARGGFSSRPVHQLVGHTGSCLAAAFTAAVGVGLTDKWDDAAALIELGEVIMPNPAHASVCAASCGRFRKLYRPT